MASSSASFLAFSSRLSTSASIFARFSIFFRRSSSLSRRIRSCAWSCRFRACSWCCASPSHSLAAASTGTAAALLRSASLFSCSRRRLAFCRSSSALRADSSWARCLSAASRASCSSLLFCSASFCSCSLLRAWRCSDSDLCACLRLLSCSTFIFSISSDRRRSSSRRCFSARCRFSSSRRLSRASCCSAMSRRFCSASCCSLCCCASSCCFLSRSRRRAFSCTSSGS
mmetsp:Transcript_14141/g.40119  ORF Transcript_14141/g.40119 Transcript_14141/m.40119 type:complete len:228 (+) Transcript_14141:474-1157(+)